MTDPSRPRVLLVTGTTGIAASAALAATHHGWSVHVVGIDRETLDELLCACRQQSSRSTGTVADLTDSRQTDNAIDAAVRQCGRIDAVFAVAGLSGRRFGDGPIDRCTDEGWATTLDGNLNTAFHTARAAIRQMRSQTPNERGLRGSVLLMGSVLATHPEPEHFATHAYAAAKGAIHTLARTLAATYAPEGIRVNAVAPGLVRTPMSARAQEDPGIVETLRTRQPLGQTFLEPDDIASAALFLLDDRLAGRITGQVLAVDGGWSVGH